MWLGAFPMLSMPGVHPGAGGHQRPEAGPVFAAGSIVQVRQAQVMAVLVSKYTYAAVLGLDGVLANPEIAVTDPDAAVRIEGWSLSIRARADSRMHTSCGSR